jgi:hypothetical protein
MTRSSSLSALSTVPAPAQEEAASPTNAAAAIVAKAAGARTVLLDKIVLFDINKVREQAHAHREREMLIEMLIHPDRDPYTQRGAHTHRCRPLGLSAHRHTDTHTHSHIERHRRTHRMQMPADQQTLSNSASTPMDG